MNERMNERTEMDLHARLSTATPLAQVFQKFILDVKRTVWQRRSLGRGAGARREGEHGDGP